MTRCCSKCKVDKPLSEFYKNKSQPEGHEHYCKQCAKEAKHKYRASEKGQAYLKAYQASEQFKAVMRRYANSVTHRQYIQSEKYKQGQKKYRQSKIGRKKAKEWRVNHPQRLHHWTLMRRYGITLKKYNQMLSQQGGKCAICNSTNACGHNLSVDHDHTSGKVRGLVCKRCNYLIGVVEWEHNKLEKIFRYLIKETENESTT